MTLRKLYRGNTALMSHEQLQWHVKMLFYSIPDFFY